MKKEWLILLCLFGLSPLLQAKLVNYPAPENAQLNADFTVQVRQAEQVWQKLPSYLVFVDKNMNARHTAQESSMAYFDFSGEVEISVTYNDGDIQTARIRPLSLGIVPQIKGNTLTFKLNQPRNLSIEVNGDIFHNLHLFANPMYENVPNKNDTNVIYFEPGIHQIKNKRLIVPSGKTVYIAGGAILLGQIIFEHTENAKLIGHGMIDQSFKHGVEINNSKNIEIDGVFCANCFTGGSENVVIRNVKSMSYGKWGDGMNVISSKNVLIDGAFCRNSDDCTTVYGSRGRYSGGCSNISMQNSTLWADVAHPVLIGTHGSTPSPEYLEKLTYRNIDILDHNEKQLDYQGCMSLNAGDSNFIRDVIFENIRVEDFRQGQLFNLRVFYNSKYCTSPGRGIENVLFRNISYNGKNTNISIIAGYDEQRKIKNVSFENLVINGTHISDTMPDKPGYYKTGDMARIFIGEHVENVVFK